MQDVIDDDTAAAIRTLWQSDLAKLPALVKTAPQYGRLKAPQAMPYVQLSCESANSSKPDMVNNVTGAISDRRKATIKIWAIKADAVQAIKYAGNLFNRDTVLVYPSGARFMRWWPTTMGKLEQDDTVKSAQDVWIASIEAEVWSIRY